MKRCWRCDTEKLVVEFCKDSSRWDGLSPLCKNCRKAANSAYRKKHLTRVRSREEAFNRSHSERVTAKRRRYYETHATSERARSDVFRRQNLSYYREAEARRRALKASSQVAPVNYLRIRERDGMTCHICGKSVPDAQLHFDHVIPLSRGGPHIESNIAVAHAFCNQSKSARPMSEVTFWRG